MVSFSIKSFSRVEFGSSVVLLLMASYRSDLTCSLINLSVHLQVPHFFCWFCKCFNCSHLFHKEIDFIKATDHLSTDHRLTDHRPLTHWPKNHRPRPTDPLIQESPTHRQDYVQMTRSMKTFILQNANTAGEMESNTSIWIGSKSLIE